MHVHRNLWAAGCIAIFALAAFSLPTAAVTVAPGDVVFNTDGSIHKLEPGTGNVTLISDDSNNGVSGGYGNLNAMAYEPGRGTVLVVDRGNQALFRVDPADGSASVVTDTSASDNQIGTQMFGVDLDGPDAVLTDRNANKLFKADRTTGAQSLIRTNGYLDVETAPDGDYMQADEDRLIEISSDGSTLDVVGSGVSGAKFLTSDNTSTGDGIFLVTDFSRDTLDRYNANTDTLSTVVDFDDFSGTLGEINPQGAVQESDGSFIVSDNVGERFLSVSSDGNTVTEITGFTTGTLEDAVLVTIPEPASLALLAPAGLLMLRRRR